jgi:tRNA(Ile)-lysidine synthase
VLVRPENAISDAWKTVGLTYGRNEVLRLAVSGGADSLAMLVGLVRLRDTGLLNAALEVVTVDHGLRPDSAKEAAMVADVSGRLGVDCQVATLTPPETIRNKQAWARTERYRVLAELGGRSDPTVLTAHTADDQAETLLMRAARGSGSEGLAGIRSPARVAGASVHRPFLWWKREELRSVLDGTPWEPAQDPSNADEAFTRVRFRHWLADAPTPDSHRSVAQGLAETARIAALESAALGHYADQMVVAVGGAQHGFVHGHVAFRESPRAVQARFLRTVLALIARRDDRKGMGFNASFDLARMVTLAERMKIEPSGRWVGGGAVLDWQHEGSAQSQGWSITAFAEAGRPGFPAIELEAGETAIWDGRFEVENRSGRTVKVRAWTADDPLPPCGTVMPPKKILASLPVAVQGGEVMAWAIAPVITPDAESSRNLPVFRPMRRFLPS